MRYSRKLLESFLIEHQRRANGECGAGCKLRLGSSYFGHVLDLYEDQAVPLDRTIVEVVVRRHDGSVTTYEVQREPATDGPVGPEST